MTALTLAQQRAIDLHKEQLVTAAEKLLDEAGFGANPPRDFGDSQFRNLLALASETQSPSVIYNFIRYQMGRDAKAEKNWCHQFGERRVGHRFLEQLEGEQGELAQIMDDIGETEAVAKQRIRMELIRHFLGFAARYRKYLSLKTKQPAGGAA